MKGVAGVFSNGTSLYFIYLQMEENENVFWIAFLHTFSFGSYRCGCVRVHICALVCTFLPVHLIQAPHPSPPPLLVAHPQGYGISGHLITTSLHAKYIVAVSRTPAIVFVCTFHYAFKPLSGRGCSPAVMNEHDLGKQKGWRTMIPAFAKFISSLCSRCARQVTAAALPTAASDKGIFM